MMRRILHLLSILLALALAAGACSRSEAPPAQATAPAPESASEPAPAAADDEELPVVASPYDGLPEGARALLDVPFTGDLDQMVKRRLIRAGVAFNRTHYFIDRGQQRGIAYDSLKLFEEQLNQRLKTGNLKVNVAFVPLPRDLLLPALVEGKVDVVAAMLTVTPERQALVDFSTPTRTGVSEIAVTGPGAPPVATPDDLSGREVFVRRTSSYHESLVRLNEELARRGKEPVTIIAAPEPLEDDDILEMVNAGLVETTIVDDFLAQFWRQVFPGLTLHPGAAVRTGGTLAVAVRKNSPQLLKACDTWIREYGPRTAFGNTVEKKYLQSTKYADSATSRAEREKFQQLAGFFRKYSDQYQLDYLLMAAQGYQESRLDHGVKSPVGAVGVMQVMPATGQELAVGDISQLEPNIHAGVKYMRFMIDRYFADEPMDPMNKALMTFASYNAGPARVRKLRQEAKERGLDPNVWFGNVERIASERIGRETVTYVSNIYKYYIAYKLVIEQSETRQRLKSAAPAPAATGSPD